MKVTLLAFVLTLLVGCSGSENKGGPAEPAKPKTFQLGETQFMPSLGSEITESVGVLQGSGRLVAVRPAPNADYHYALTFQLLGDGSAISLAAKTGSDLQGGPRLTLKNGAEHLEVSLVDGNTIYDLTADFNLPKSQAPQEVGIDVHAHGHVIVWLGGLEMEYSLVNKPAGQNWGLILEKARLASAVIKGPKKDH